MKPRTKRVLDYLRVYEGQWIRGNSLAEVGGFRFGARLYELREAGFTVEKRHDPTSALPMYRLVVPVKEAA